jgi:cyclase
MPLCKRVVPTLLCKGRTLYKGVSFKASERSIGHAAQAVRVHAARGVDELCLLDITATAENRGPDLGLVKELSEELFIPLTVGGGVRSCQDIDALLRAGADKVAIGSAAVEVRGLLAEASERFGRQAIVASVDVKGWRCTYRCGSKALRHAPKAWARWVEGRGAGEILLTSVDRDGTLGGYDLDLIREVSAATSIPVIASGGCGSYADMLAAIHAGADAVAAGAVFQYTDCTPRGAAKYLQKAGVCVRL